MEIIDNNNNNQVVLYNNPNFEAFFYNRLRKYIRFVKIFILRFFLTLFLYMIYDYINKLILKHERLQEMARAEEYRNMVYNDYICSVVKHLWNLRGLNGWNSKLCYYFHLEMYKYAQELREKQFTFVDTYMYVK